MLQIAESLVISVQKYTYSEIPRFDHLIIGPLRYKVRFFFFFFFFYQILGLRYKEQFLATNGKL